MKNINAVAVSRKNAKEIRNNYWWNPDEAIKLRKNNGNNINNKNYKTNEWWNKEETKEQTPTERW